MIKPTELVTSKLKALLSDISMIWMVLPNRLFQGLLILVGTYGKVEELMQTVGS